MLNRETYGEFMEFLIEAKRWKVSDKFLQTTFEQVENLVDDVTFAGIADRIVSQDFTNPDAVVKACRDHRKLEQNSSPPPALPPASHDGRPCEEFVRVCRQMRAARLKQLPNFAACCPHGTPCKRPSQVGQLQRCQCLDEWNARPLTDEDWQLGRKTEPAALVAMGTAL